MQIHTQPILESARKLLAEFFSNGVTNVSELLKKGRDKMT
jgi:hypothetical protein